MFGCSLHGVVLDILGDPSAPGATRESPAPDAARSAAGATIRLLRKLILAEPSGDLDALASSARRTTFIVLRLDRECQSASMCGRDAGNRQQHMGRSCGVLTSKIQAVVYTNSLPVHLGLTPGDTRENPSGTTDSFVKLPVCRKLP
jgi:hypothetical protein